jgi:hypothetical protein
VADKITKLEDKSLKLEDKRTQLEDKRTHLEDKSLKVEDKIFHNFNGCFYTICGNNLFRGQLDFFFLLFTYL